MTYLLVYKGKRSGITAGFSLFELMVVACIVAIMATVLLNRVLFYQKMAEKTAVEQTVGILRSALQLQFASLVAKNRMDEVPTLAKQNPMGWLAQKPPNYAGEYFGEEPEDVVEGQWYFDLKDRNLVYLVHHRSNVQTHVPAQIRFKTELLWAGEDFPDADKQVAGKTIEGVVLKQIVPYAWN